MRRSGEDIDAEVYRRAALERIATAEQLLEAQDYVMASYLAGLGVECMLRAYRLRIDASFEGRHDLRALAEESGFIARVPAQHQLEIATALHEVALRWSNSHRFRSIDALRRFCVRAGLHGLPAGRTVRDVVRHNAVQVVAEARKIVDIGERLWR